MSDLGLVEFAGMRAALVPHAATVTALWNSLDYYQRRAISRKFGMETELSAEQIMRYFPDVALFLLTKRGSEDA